VIFVTSSAPYLARIIRLKRADQHSLAAHWMVLAGYAIMIAWGIAIHAGWTYLASYLVSVALAVLEMGVLVRYGAAEKTAGATPTAVL
jgi:hypothetical protein